MQERELPTALFVLTLAFLPLLFGCAAAEATEAGQAAKVVVETADTSLRVLIDGELFTEYHFSGFNKPILYPVIGPHGGGMTRNYPMKKVEGEAEDHVHHKSLWFTHGNVNGTDFWTESARSRKVGKTVHDKFLAVTSGETGSIKVTNKWINPDEEVVCTDTREIVISSTQDSRTIDYAVTIHASEGDVVFGDTKEGTMGIRTHPNLRLKNAPKHGVTTAAGHAVNSAGHRDGDLWGKRAKWVDYWAPIDGQTVGVAIFDHPSNPRHPTWWHARDYGLIGANAFGVHNFEQKPKGTGDFKIAAGESATFRYRFVFHKGDVKEAAIEARYEDFAAGK
jgi:hypothetical protein